MPEPTLSIPLNDAGGATYSLSQLLQEYYTVVAKYSGDSTYIRSTSAILRQNIK